MCSLWCLSDLVVNISFPAVMPSRKAAVEPPFICMVSSISVCRLIGSWEGRGDWKQGYVTALERKLRKGAVSDSTLGMILDLRVGSEDSRQRFWKSSIDWKKWMSSNETANAIEVLGFLLSVVRLSFHTELGHNFSQSSKKIIFLPFGNLTLKEMFRTHAKSWPATSIHWLTFVPCHLDTLR